MDTNTKYRRWGWGAVIGLIAVILIAGLVVALTMNKKPKTDAEIASSDGESGVVVVEDDENSHDSSANSGDESGNSGSTENGGSSSSSQNGGSSNSGSSSSQNGGSSNSGSSNSGSSSSSNADQNSHDSSANNSGSSSTDANKKEMPKTGPVDTTFAILGMAATAYLLSLNVALAKDKARK